MVKLLPLFAAGLLAGCSLSPEDITLNAEQQANYSASAEKAFIAFASFDVDGILKYTHHSLPEGIGAERYTEFIQQSAKENGEQTLLGTLIKAPECEAGKRIVCIAPYKYVVKSGDETSLVRGYMIGLSEDNGDSWGYLEGSHKEDGVIKKLVPDLPIGIPNVQSQPCTPKLCDWATAKKEQP